ncbi:MAG: hypothetical protein R3C03_22580, partial [Pirellulaceae bacterium]
QQEESPQVPVVDSESENTVEDNDENRVVTRKVVVDGTPGIANVADESSEDIAEANLPIGGNDVAEISANELPGSTFTNSPAPAAAIPQPVSGIVTSDAVSETVSEPAMLAEKSENVGFGTGFAIFTIPMIASVAVFLLIWSVISGWFERLIF